MGEILCKSRKEAKLKKKKGGKHWEDLVGYTLQKLIKHLESQFEDWMNWDNYGAYDENRCTWQVDHILAVSKSKTFEEIWRLENLRPLESIKNMRKSNRTIEEFEAIYGK